MASIMEIMQLCRLCLIKEQVNIPIFEDQGDIRQIFLKITACLPVKVSKEDQLPKKICDGCLYKLELLYQFWNTTANAEKQLLSWIEQSNMDLNSKPSEESSINTHPQVKQEKIEPTESTNENADLSADAQNYILQQQQLAYQANFPYKESQGSNVEGDDAVEDPEEPEPKRRRRGQRRQATKPIPPESLDSSDNEAADTLMEMTVTKTEEESESDGDENVDDPESSKFVTVAEDREQPGPSGLGKGTTEAPFKKEKGGAKITFDAILQCSECPKAYKSIEYFKRHKLSHKMRACNVCNKVFKCTYNLQRHHKAVHEKNATYICDVCDKDFTTKSYLEVHKAIHFKNYKHKCDKCDSGYPSLSALKSHQNVQHSGVRFMCTNCGKIFMNEYYYKKHLLTHEPNYTKKEYTCPICSKVLFYKKTYKNHMKIHNGRDYHICEICGKALTAIQSLIDHKRLHTGEKPFVCEVCGKGFTNKKLIRTHKRTHSKEKPYTCKICGKSFTQRTTLTIHIRYHTGERPYSCNICQKKFITRTLLKTHSKIHGSFIG